MSREAKEDNSNIDDAPVHVYAPIDFDMSLENAEMYRPGGWHPVTLGDTLNQGRYEVVHKLGFGGYSTVWLAIDHTTNWYVAIKISAADSGSTSSLPHEANILKRLSKDTMESIPNEIFALPELYDDFQVIGPNGVHRCLVTEPLRCSITDTQEASSVGSSKIEAARCIATQTILAVQKMHKLCIAHGDIHPGNVMLARADLETVEMASLYGEYGAPTEKALRRLDGQPLGPEAPAVMYESMSKYVKPEDLSVNDCKTVLIDFGEAWDVNSTPKLELHTPYPWRAPEGYFEPSNIGLAADVWSLGCTLYDILGTRLIFEASDKESAIAEYMAVLGHLPPKWWQSWEARHDLFDEDSQRWRSPYKSAPGSMPLRELVCRMLVADRLNFSPMSTEEADALTELLESMIVYEPRKRATIDEVVQSRWMTEWGLPELKRALLSDGHLEKAHDDAVALDSGTDIEAQMESAEKAIVGGVIAWVAATRACVLKWMDEWIAPFNALSA